MLYQSKYADLQVLVRSRSPIFHHATGVQTGEITPLIANFGTHGGEVPIEDPYSGQIERHAVIHGHFFDSEEAAERLGWNEDEKQAVESQLDRLCVHQPYLIARVEHTAATIPELVIAAPWGNYDTMHWRSIAPTAETVGMLAEALVYERQTTKREGVIAALEERLGAGAPEPAEPPVEESEMITL